MRRLHLALALAVSLGLGMAAGVLPGHPSQVEAQVPCSDSTDCDFMCTNLTDDWIQEDGMWVIVHAQPRNTSSSSDTFWKDETSG